MMIMDGTVKQALIVSVVSRSVEDYKCQRAILEMIRQSANSCCHFCFSQVSWEIHYEILDTTRFMVIIQRSCKVTALL